MKKSVHKWDRSVHPGNSHRESSVKKLLDSYQKIQTYYDKSSKVSDIEDKVDKLLNEEITPFGVDKEFDQFSNLDSKLDELFNTSSEIRTGPSVDKLFEEASDDIDICLKIDEFILSRIRSKIDNFSFPLENDPSR